MSHVWNTGILCMCMQQWFKIRDQKTWDREDFCFGKNEFWVKFGVKCVVQAVHEHKHRVLCNTPGIDVINHEGHPAPRPPKKKKKKMKPIGIFSIKSCLFSSPILRGSPSCSEYLKTYINFLNFSLVLNCVCLCIFP